MENKEYTVGDNIPKDWKNQNISSQEDLGKEKLVKTRYILGKIYRFFIKGLQILSILLSLTYLGICTYRFSSKPRVFIEKDGIVLDFDYIKKEHAKDPFKRDDAPRYNVRQVKDGYVEFGYKECYGCGAPVINSWTIERFKQELVPLCNCPEIYKELK